MDNSKHIEESVRFKLILGGNLAGLPDIVCDTTAHVPELESEDWSRYLDNPQAFPRRDIWTNSMSCLCRGGLSKTTSIISTPNKPLPSQIQGPCFLFVVYVA